MKAENRLIFLVTFFCSAFARIAMETIMLHYLDMLDRFFGIVSKIQSPSVPYTCLYWSVSAELGCM